VSEHEKTKVELIEELRIKDHAFRSAMSPIAISNLEGNLTYVNPAFLDVWGYQDEEEVLGREAVEFWQMEEQAAQVIGALQEQGRWSGELNARRKDGMSFDVQVAASMVTDEDGQPLGMMASFRDITERRRVEALASKTPILRGVNRVFRDALGGETEEELAMTCLEIAEELTESQFGFICEVNQRGRLDTVAISDPGWDECLIENSDDLIRAQDLPVRGIRGRVIEEERAMIFNDPPAHPDWIEPPEGHPTLTSFMGVPMEDAGGRAMGLIALANKEGGYDEDDQEAVAALSVAIVQALERKRMEAALARQAEEILEISTPTMQVWDGVVASPLIGTLDSRRTQRFMEDLLSAIVDTGSEIALVDITGVPTIDTLTAQHMIETIDAVRLLGADVILTGVRPSIAQTLVNLGIDLSGITTRSSLAAGLRVALDMLGLRIARQD
jgi:PAS domain S-box-containing protein